MCCAIAAGAAASMATLKKSSFKQADEIKDVRDKEFLSQFERVKEGRRIRDEKVRRWSERLDKNFMDDEN